MSRLRSEVSTPSCCSDLLFRKFPQGHTRAYISFALKKADLLPRNHDLHLVSPLKTHRVFSSSLHREPQLIRFTPCPYPFSNEPSPKTLISYSEVKRKETKTLISYSVVKWKGTRRVHSPEIWHLSLPSPNRRNPPRHLYVLSSLSPRNLEGVPHSA